MNCEDFSRCNRSYEVFKTMCGTSMYYEVAKKNVIEIANSKLVNIITVLSSSSEELPIFTHFFGWKILMESLLLIFGQQRKILKARKKIEEIENIANMLISASEDSALCEEHHEVMENKRRQSQNCNECYAASSDFDECSKHKTITQKGEY